MIRDIRSHPLILLAQDTDIPDIFVPNPVPMPFDYSQYILIAQDSDGSDIFTPSPFPSLPGSIQSTYQPA
jgi:hypothetical protein